MKADKIIFATGNAGKMKEIRMIMADLDIEVQSMKEAEIQAEIVENGETFEENAKIKAQAIAQELRARGEQAVVLADDSGLEIDYLNKEPGVYSARYMGEDTSYTVKNANLVQRLEGVPDEERTARFVCVIAAVFPDGRVFQTRATIEGRIGYEEKGELLETIRMLDFIRKHCVGNLDEGLRVPLSFSFGYSLSSGELDYQEMLKEADANMYEDKRERKGEEAR